jgi:hypothetical protein
MKRQVIKNIGQFVGDKTQDLVNWQVIRTIGELQVLTKMSYATLVIVPTLATLWPGMKSSIEAFNQIYVKNPSHHAISESHHAISDMLPISWAAGFFAALLAIFAHFIYQATAPLTVRQRTSDQFVRDKVEDYVQRKTT